MKRFLKELTKEELQKVWSVNSRLQEGYCNRLYEQNMDMQYEDGNMFLDKARKYFDFNDYYNSFFLTLRQFERLQFFK